MQIIGSSIAKSYLWKHFKVFKLKQNMRVLKTDLTEDEWSIVRDFSSWLLDIVDRKVGQPDEEDPHDTSWVTIPR